MVPLDYRTYAAQGWTIEASESGIRFTNDATTRGMVVATDGVRRLLIARSLGLIKRVFIKRV